MEDPDDVLIPRHQPILRFVAPCFVMAGQDGGQCHVAGKDQQQKDPVLLPAPAGMLETAEGLNESGDGSTHPLLPHEPEQA